MDVFFVRLAVPLLQHWDYRNERDDLLVEWLMSLSQVVLDRVLLDETR